MVELGRALVDVAVRVDGAGDDPSSARVNDRGRRSDVLRRTRERHDHAVPQADVGRARTPRSTEAGIANEQAQLGHVGESLSVVRRVRSGLLRRRGSASRRYAGSTSAVAEAASCRGFPVGFGAGRGTPATASRWPRPRPQAPVGRRSAEERRSCRAAARRSVVAHFRRFALTCHPIPVCLRNSGGIRGASPAWFGPQRIHLVHRVHLHGRHRAWRRGADRRAVGHERIPG